MKQSASRILGQFLVAASAAIDHVRRRNNLLLNSANEVVHAQSQIVDAQLFPRDAPGQQHAGDKTGSTHYSLIEDRETALLQERAVGSLSQPARSQTEEPER